MPSATVCHMWDIWLVSNTLSISTIYAFGYSLSHVGYMVGFKHSFYIYHLCLRLQSATCGIYGWFQTLFLYLPSMPSATVCHMWDIWLVSNTLSISTIYAFGYSL